MLMISVTISATRDIIFISDLQFWVQQVWRNICIVVVYQELISVTQSCIISFRIISDPDTTRCHEYNARCHSQDHGHGIFWSILSCLHIHFLDWSLFTLSDPSHVSNSPHSKLISRWSNVWMVCAGVATILACCHWSQDKTGAPQSYIWIYTTLIHAVIQMVTLISNTKDTEEGGELFWADGSYFSVASDLSDS